MILEIILENKGNKWFARFFNYGTPFLPFQGLFKEISDFFWFLVKNSSGKEEKEEEFKRFDRISSRLKGLSQREEKKMERRRRPIENVRKNELEGYL